MNQESHQYLKMKEAQIIKGEGKVKIRENTTETADQTLILDQATIDRRVFYRSGKRIFDFITSLLALIVLIPVFLIIAIAIKADDPKGGILYSQKRIGRNGRPFKMFKFRSMQADADKRLNQLLKYNEIEGAMFKMKDDPRITRVGRVIRKYSLDELPQLLNVVLGNMALVGPRPPLEREVNKYTDYDKQRLMVVPGCTGLWQVTGRNELDFSEMVDLDISYIQKSSFHYDIWIMVRTVWIMVHPNQAY